MDQEHEESWHMHIYNKLLTTLVKLVLLVVNSVKLHLTAYNLNRIISLGQEVNITSVANCCRPPMLIGPSSEAYKLQPPTQRSLVGHTIPHVKPTGLSLKIALAAP